MSRPGGADETASKPVRPLGGAVEVYIYAGVPQQHTRGRAAQTQSRPPWRRMKSTASELASTRIDFLITSATNPSMAPNAGRSKLALA
jgi:hypothetical protein